MCRYNIMADEELIRCLRNGEKEITEYIINKYKNLVKEKAKAMFLLGGDNDDLICSKRYGITMKSRKLLFIILQNCVFQDRCTQQSKRQKGRNIFR